jgi:hypothetical protein
MLNAATSRDTSLVADSLLKKVLKMKCPFCEEDADLDIDPDRYFCESCFSRFRLNERNEPVYFNTYCPACEWEYHWDSADTIECSCFFRKFSFDEVGNTIAGFVVKGNCIRCSHELVWSADDIESVEVRCLCWECSGWGYYAIDRTGELLCRCRSCVGRLQHDQFTEGSGYAGNLYKCSACGAVQFVCYDSDNDPSKVTQSDETEESEEGTDPVFTSECEEWDDVQWLLRLSELPEWRRSEIRIADAEDLEDYRSTIPHSLTTQRLSSLDIGIFDFEQIVRRNIYEIFARLSSMSLIEINKKGFANDILREKCLWVRWLNSLNKDARERRAKILDSVFLTLYLNERLSKTAFEGQAVFSEKWMETLNDQILLLTETP